MAIYKIFPEKDATLYSAYPSQNTGLDEILEVSTTYLPDNPEVSRFLGDKIFHIRNYRY